MSDANEIDKGGDIVVSGQSRPLAVAEAPQMQMIPLSSAEVVRHKDLVVEVVNKVMRQGVHFGVIPGTSRMEGDKETAKKALLKPGSDVLCVTFQFVTTPNLAIVELPNWHREYRVRMDFHTRGGVYLGCAHGTCSTMESKYRYRKGERICPECGAAAIIKSKFADCAWLCFAKKGGCGAKFQKDDADIESQEVGKVENDNPADVWNTCEKMAEKRALAGGVLRLTAASDMFDQRDDLDDDDMNGENEPPPARGKPRTTAPRTIDQAQPTAPLQEPFPPADDSAAISDAQRKRLFTIARANGWQDDDIKYYLKEAWSIESSKAIPRGNYDEIVTHFESKKVVAGDE